MKYMKVLKQFNCKYKKEVMQIWCILAFFVIFWDSSFIANFKTINITNDIICKTILVNLIFLLVSIYLFCLCYGNLSVYCCRLKNKIKNNILLLVLLIIYGISSFGIFDFWLMYDGNAYYTSLMDIKVWNFKNIFNLNLCGHRSFLSSMWMLIGEYILPNNTYGVRFMTIIMVEITLVAFYGIVRKFYPKEDKLSAILITAVFAFNPFIWSGIGEINIDLPVVCALICAIYCHQKKFYIFHAFSLMFMCFSKETGVVLYAGYMLGWVIGFSIHAWNKEKKIRAMIRKIINVPMMLSVFVGVFYIIIYLFVIDTNGWGGEVSAMVADGVSYTSARINSFSKWLPYMIHKLKQFLFVNYGWVYGCLFFAIVIIWLFKEKILKIREVDKQMISIMFFSFFSFYNFNILFVTWPNYRYIVPWSFYEGIVLTIFVFGLIRKVKYQRLFAIFMLCISLISNYYPDILSKYFFNMVDLGNGKMVNLQLFTSEGPYATLEGETEIFGYADLGVTNRQYVYRGKCINKFLKEIKYDEKCLVVMPYIFNDESTEYLFGRHSDSISGVTDLYVEKNKYKLQINNKDNNLAQKEKYVHFNNLFLAQEEVLDTDIYNQYNRIYYIYFPFNKDNFDETIFLKHYKIIEEFNYKMNSTQCEIYRIK